MPKEKSFPIKGVAAKEEASWLILLWHTSESRCANWDETVQSCNSSTWGTEAIEPGFTVIQSYSEFWDNLGYMSPVSK